MTSEESPLRKFLFWGAVGIHAFAPLIFLTRFTFNPYSVQIVFLQMALLIVWGGVGFRAWSAQSIRAVRTPLDLPLILFGGWALLTWGLSFLRHGPFFRPGIFHEGWRGNLFLWVNGIGTFFFSTQVARDPKAPIINKIILGVGGLSAAYGILQYLGVDPIWGADVNPFSGRPVSTYGNPNFLSSVLVLLLPLVVHGFLTARRRAETFGWAILALTYFAALVSTMTRSSWIGAGIALSLYALLDRKIVFQAWGRASLWVGGTIGLLFLWPTSSLGSPSPLSRLVELWKGIAGTTVYQPWHQRLLIWRSAWDMWSERPWTGKGWGLFELFFPYYQGRLLFLEKFQGFRTHANNAHELILEVGSQTGLIGVGLIGWLLLTLGMTHRASLRRHTPPMMSLAAALLSGLAGMAADNVFGNVSLFFAVPGFLYFWILGQWSALSGEEQVLHVPLPLRRGISAGLLTVIALNLVCLGRGLLAEAAFFRGSQAPADSHLREEELLLSQRWNPLDVHTNFSLGTLYSTRADKASSQHFPEVARENIQKAVDAYTQALRSNPGYDELFEGRAQGLRSLNRPSEAESDLRMALLINPLRIESYVSLDFLLSNTVDSTPSRIRFLEQATEIHPEDSSLSLLLAWVLASSGKSTEAAKVYQGLLARDPENLDAWNGLKGVGSPVSPTLLAGRELLFSIRENARKGRWAESHAGAERLVELFPLFPLARLMSADTAAQLGLDDVAVRRYREFLAQHPEHAQAQENLAKVLARKGQTNALR